MEKVLEEVHVVFHNHDKLYVKCMTDGTEVPSMLAIGLTTRLNLYLYPEVSVAK